jgi:hypothetical protein
MSMSDTELDAAIAACPYEKVTKVMIEERIDGTEYIVLPNSTVTVCKLTMQNGYTVIGESACVDARNFNLEIGRQIAYRNAVDKIWQLEGYLMAERKWIREQGAKA